MTEIKSSLNARITLDFGDDTHTFRLAIAQMIELQDVCDAGPMEILRRLTLGHWRVQDVAETIRLGLIGGGLAPPQALKLIRTYVHERPWAESVPLAAAVISAAMVGVKKAEQAAVGELQPEETGRTPPAESTPPPISEQAP